MALKLETDHSKLHGLLMGQARSKGVYGKGNDRGVCFRVSYKWLVTCWQGQAFKGDAMNVAKAGQKQMDYLKQADLVDKSSYALWFKNANALSKTTLQTWGAKHGHGCADPFVAKSLQGADPLKNDPDTAMIVGFFGDGAKGIWGHATAYCHRGTTRRFFDINYGEYSFGSGDDPAQTMQDFITSKYVDKDSKIDDFVLYRVY